MRIHFVGIGGISMRGLAAYMVDQGHEVTGCDDHLEQLPGLRIQHGHTPDHVTGADLVVINSAITPSHAGWVEVEAARSKNIRVRKRAEVIGDLTRDRQTIAVSGTHGKSTTTGMIAEILIAARLDPLVLIGAPLASGATYRAGRGPLVLEADEFDRSFLHGSPDIAVITNIEADHLDYYRGGLPEIIEAFRDFLHNLTADGQAILSFDDAVSADLAAELRDSRYRTVQTYGRRDGADYQLRDSHITPGANHFAVIGPGDEEPTQLRLSVPGLHNQLNATAALAVADRLGVERSMTVAALEQFPGVGLRFEHLSTRAGIDYYFDYGHHPTEIAVTLAAARAWFPERRLVVVFQPHQYARTKLLFQEFVRVLAAADQVLVTDIYGVAGREDDQSISGANLAAAIRTQAGASGRYLPLGTLATTVPAHLQAGDVVLFLGAGLGIRAVAMAFSDHPLVQ